MSLAHTVASAVACAGLLACGDGSGPGGFELAQLEGSYRATHLVYQAVADTTRQQDQVVQGTQQVHLHVDGTIYDRVDSFPGNPIGEIVVDSGSVSLTADTLFFNSAHGESSRYRAALVFGTLILRDSLNIRLLCPTQCVEPVRLKITMVRE